MSGSRRRLKILFLNSSRRWGGTESWLALAARSLHGHAEAHLACRDAELWRDRFAPSLRLPFRFEADPATLLGLVRFVRSHGIDVLVPTKRKDYALAGQVARLTGVANVLRLGIVRNLADRPHNRLVYRAWADGIVVNAERIRTALAAAGFVRPERVRVIYNGVDAGALTERARDYEPDLPPFPFTVCTLGELSPRKDASTLLEGFARFRRETAAEAGLLLIGEGPDREPLRARAAALGLADSVMLPGFLANPHPYLRRSDVFVMTSRNEGIANALLEAMALGTIVVTTAAGGAAELIEDGVNGILVPDDSPDAVAGALARLFTRPEERARIAAAGLRTVLTRCSPDRMARELHAFLEEIASRRRARRGGSAE